jgi:hypothetical protein
MPDIPGEHRFHDPGSPDIAGLFTHRTILGLDT